VRHRGWQYLAEVKDLLVRKFREVFSTGGINVNYRAFLRAVKATEHGIRPEDVQVMMVVMVMTMMMMTMMMMTLCILFQCNHRPQVSSGAPRP
jgi:hypothetical protein